MIKKIAVYIPSIIIPMAINILYLLMNTNFLNSSEYGALSIYMSSINLIYSFLLSAVQTASFRFYSLKNEIKDKQTYLSTYVISNIMLSFLGGICTLILNLFIVQLNPVIVVLSILSNGLYTFYVNLFRLENNYKSYNSSMIFINVLKIIIYIILILGVNKVTYLHPLVAMYGSYTILMVIETFKRKSDIRFKFFSFKLLLSSFKYAYPLIGATIMNLLLTSSDQYLILYYLNESDVGLYSFGYKIADTILINLSMLILLVMYPMIMDTYDNKNIKEAEQQLTKMINLNFWISIPVVVWLFINIGSVISAFFPNFIAAEQISQNIIIVSFFHSLSMYLSKGLELGKNTKQLLYDLTVSVFVNIIYNIIFIPVYGILAAAHSSILSYLIYNFLLIRHSRNHINIYIDYKFIFKVFVVTIMALVVPRMLLFYNSNSSIVSSILQLIGSGIIYIIISYRAKMFNEFN